MEKTDTSKKTEGKSTKPHVGILTNEQVQRSGDTPLNDLIKLLAPLTNRIVIITGEHFRASTSGVEIIQIKATRRTSVTGRVLQQGITHVRQLRVLFSLRRKIDILIIAAFATPFPVPLIFAQALGIKCFITLETEGDRVRVEAAAASGTRQHFGELALLRIQEACARISYYLCDRLIAPSWNVVHHMKLNRYVDKIAIYPKYVSDFDLFAVTTELDARRDVIGYVGRLCHEKGALNLVKAIPQVVSERPQLSFTIIGEGSLRAEIQQVVDSNSLAKHVELVSWVPHEELPAWLNTFKLVVIPSYTETGPIIMFESMACKTPVLAAPVGSVSDVIEDGKTGFLLENNSPACIARSILRAISSPDLERISQDGYDYVRENYTYARALEAWRKILSTSIKDDVS